MSNILVDQCQFSLPFVTRAPRIARNGLCRCYEPIGLRAGPDVIDLPPTRGDRDATEKNVLRQRDPQDPTSLV